MTVSSIPRLWIAGTRASCGKSLIVTGILQALRRRGHSVSCCVSGRGLQQAAVLERLSRRYVRCLDSTLVDDVDFLNAIGQVSLGADLVLIDGYAGLFDPHHSDKSARSDAELAQLSLTPCILVVDSRDISPSLCAVVAGFVNFSHAPNIVGVIINGLERREVGKPLALRAERDHCNELFSQAGLPPCIGCIAAQALQSQSPPTGILQEENCAALPLNFLVDVESMVSEAVSIEELLDLARVSPQITYTEVQPVVERGKCRIAVARDNCFYVCYQDNLELMRMLGAELVRFSPLADRCLPRGVGGVYLPGACLGEYADDIERNREFLGSLGEFVRAGGVLFSEGSGSAILCKTFQPAGCERAFRGAGVLPLHVHEAYHAATTARVTVLDGSVLGDFGEVAGGLTVGNWHIKKDSQKLPDKPGMINTLRFESLGGVTSQEGYSVSAQSCSTFNFIHFGSNTRLAQALVEAASIHQMTTPSAKR